MGLASEIDRLVVKLVADASIYNDVMVRVETRTLAMARRLTSAGTTMSLALTTPLAGFGALAVREFSKFDDAMTKSLAIMSGVSDEMRMQMANVAKDISSMSVTAPDKVAESFYFLASAGYDAETSMKAVAVVEKFATAAALDMAKATSYLANSQSALGLAIGTSEQKMMNMKRVSDVLTMAANAADGSQEEFAKALTTKSAVALKLVNKEIEEGVAVLEAYAMAGIKGESAGEKLDITMRELQRVAIKEKAAWDSLGLSVFDGEGKMRHMADIIGDLEKKLAGASSQQKIMVMTMLGFRAESFGAIAPLIGQSKAIREFEEANKQASLGMGESARVAEKQNKSFANQMLIAWNNIKLVGIEIGENLAPAVVKLNGYVSAAAKWWRGLPPGVKQATVAFAAAAAAVGPLMLGMGFFLYKLPRFIDYWQRSVAVLKFVPGLAKAVTVELWAMARAQAANVVSGVKQIPVIWQSVLDKVKQLPPAVSSAVGTARDVYRKWMDETQGKTFRLAPDPSMSKGTLFGRWVQDRITGFRKLEASGRGTFSKIGGYGSTALQAIRSGLSTGTAAVRSFTMKVWAATKPYLSIKVLAKATYDGIIKGAQAMGDATLKAWGYVEIGWTKAEGVIVSGWGRVKAAASQAWPMLKAGSAATYRGIISGAEGMGNGVLRGWQFAERGLMAGFAGLSRAGMAAFSFLRTGAGPNQLIAPVALATRTVQALGAACRATKAFVMGLSVTQAASTVVTGLWSAAMTVASVAMGAVNAALALGPAALIAIGVGIAAAVVGWDSFSAGAAAAQEDSNKAWEGLKNDAFVAFDGIKEAVKAGDWAGAFEILGVTIKLAWTRILNELEQMWRGFADDLFVKMMKVKNFGKIGDLEQVLAEERKSMSNLRGIQIKGLEGQRDATVAKVKGRNAAPGDAAAPAGIPELKGEKMWDNQDGYLQNMKGDFLNKSDHAQLADGTWVTKAAQQAHAAAQAAAPASVTNDAMSAADMMAQQETDPAVAAAVDDMMAHGGKKSRAGRTGAAKKAAEPKVKAVDPLKNLSDLGSSLLGVFKSLKDTGSGLASTLKEAGGAAYDMAVETANAKQEIGDNAALSKGSSESYQALYAAANMGPTDAAKKAAEEAKKADVKKSQEQLMREATPLEGTDAAMASGLGRDATPEMIADYVKQAKGTKNPGADAMAGLQGAWKSVTSMFEPAPPTAADTEQMLLGVLKSYGVTLPSDTKGMSVAGGASSPSVSSTSAPLVSSVKSTDPFSKMEETAAAQLSETRTQTKYIKEMRDKVVEDDGAGFLNGV